MYFLGAELQRIKDEEERDFRDAMRNALNDIEQKLQAQVDLAYQEASKAKLEAKKAKQQSIFSNLIAVAALIATVLAWIFP